MKVPQFDIYEDEAGKYRWRLFAKNNKIIADSAESYTRAYDAKKAAMLVINLAPLAEIVRTVEE